MMRIGMSMLKKKYNRGNRTKKIVKVEKREPIRQMLNNLHRIHRIIQLRIERTLFKNKLFINWIQKTTFNIWFVGLFQFN